MALHSVGCRETLNVIGRLPLYILLTLSQAPGFFYLTAFFTYDRVFSVFRFFRASFSGVRSHPEKV